MVLASCRLSFDLSHDPPYVLNSDGRSERQTLDIADHTQAVKILLDDLETVF